MIRNPFARLAHRKPGAPTLRPMVESLTELKELAPPAWSDDIDRAISYASGRDWWRLWDRLQAAAYANRDTPFGEAAEVLRARAERLALANTPAPQGPSTIPRGYW